MIDSLELRRLAPDSPLLATVAAWQFAAWGHLHPDADRPRWQRRLAGECGEGGVPSVFVALSEGKPVGTASLSADDLCLRPALGPWLASVFVAPEWRGRGIASTLVRRVEREARDAGITRLYLYTPDQQALYRRLGWQPLEVLDYLGETVTVMRRGPGDAG